MRRALAIAVSVLMFVPAVLAGPSADWKKVEEVKWDTPIRIELWSGQEYVGRFDSADDKTLRLKVASHERRGQTAMVQTFARADVRIVEVRSGRAGSDPGNTIRTGVAVGAVGGAVATGIASGKAWPIGAFAGGFAGAAAGAVGGGIVSIIKDSPRSHIVIVYESQHRPPVARPPAQER